ncbi:hypothetical protein J3R82DRAFT_114 [Butyriboletus roseoflavus]|nr:hypothetical protein J3R82DRAFT_114 [Butyriboletus roseoflavus]
MSSTSNIDTTMMTPNVDTTEQVLIEGLNSFILGEMARMYYSLFVAGFNKSILWHKAHLDGAHYHMRTPNGLHPAYVIFNEQSKPEKKFLKRSDFIEANLTNVFDVIAMQDCLNGGISVLLRCPGGNLLHLHPKQITIDLYVTLQELIQNTHLNGNVSILVQVFCEDFVMPHMVHFTKHCLKEGFEAPLVQGKSFLTYLHSRTS